MTLREIQILLKLHPCASIAKTIYSGRMKREVNAGSVDVYSLQSTINDHRTMINYLINNSINATYVAGAISDHHTKSFPILTSWRDIIDLFLIIVFIGFIIHCLLVRAGLSPCKGCFSLCSKCLFPNMSEQHQQHQQLQQQLQQQQELLQQLQGRLRQREQGQSQQGIIRNQSIRRNQQHIPTVASIQEIDFNTPVLRPFQPLKHYRIAPIHRLISTEYLLYLIAQIDKTKTFSIYTERCDELNTVISIQIELVQTEQKESMVLYFELLHLPDPNTFLFVLIRALINIIFHTSKRILVWSQANKEDLQILVLYAYLSKSTLDETYIIVLQGPFKQWYIKTFKHHKNCNVPSFDLQDASCCICPYRPYKNFNDQWTLEKAIQYVFQEFIYPPNGNPIVYQQINISHVYCCLAITKLLMVVELDWTIEHLYQFKKFHQ
ncbi:unnamed protein product, partial [Rotaria sordida]